LHSDPIFVAKDAGDIAILNIAFNGRGKKQVHQKDSLIASAVAEREIITLNVDPLGGLGGVSTAHPNKCQHPNATVSWQVHQNRRATKSFEHNKKKEKG
jgi:hypothetical protein